MFGVVVLLFVASRMPFLVDHHDWGVFDIEHLWMITDPAAVQSSEELAGRSDLTLATLDPVLYQYHYHAGASWVTQGIAAMGRLTGDFGLLEFKLVGLLLSVVALLAYFSSLVGVWPKEPKRWALGVVVCWLFPPTLLLWMTLMPMGHYLETWWFHAVFLPPIVSILANRDTLPFLVATGAAIGIATVYVASNVVFLVLMAVLLLVLPERSRSTRMLRVGALAGPFLVAWYGLGRDRLHLVVARAQDASRDQQGFGDLASRVAHNLGALFSAETVVHGDGFLKRGLFAVTEPPGAVFGTAAAWVIAVAALLGSLYLIRCSVLMLHPRRRTELDLPTRFLGSQGLLLGLLLGAFLLFHGTTTGRPASYLSLCVPVLMFGLSQGAAAMVTRPAAPAWLRGTLPVAALLGLLAIGWLQSCLWTNRPLDRPEVTRIDFTSVAPIIRAGLPEGQHSDIVAVEDLCNRLYGQNEAFCGTLAWQVVLDALAGAAGATDSEQSLRLHESGCAAAAAHRREDCAMAAGGARYSGEPFDEDRTSECAAFPASIRRACLSGIYRGLQVGQLQFPGDYLLELIELCKDNEDVPGVRRRRTCLERGSFLMAGMPILPAATQEQPPPDCKGWPSEWQGVCEQKEPSRVVPGQASCEQVYLERFSLTVPDRNSLIYQQCLLGELGRPGRGVYEGCVIGVAKALEGLECSWAGTELRL